jgi:hypothetical protein
VKIGAPPNAEYFLRWLLACLAILAASTSVSSGAGQNPKEDAVPETQQGVSSSNNAPKTHPPREFNTAVTGGRGLVRVRGYLVRNRELLPELARIADETLQSLMAEAADDSKARARKLSSMRQRLLTTTPSPRIPRVRLSISSSFSPASSLRSPSLESMDLATSAPIRSERGPSTNYKTWSSEKRIL